MFYLFPILIMIHQQESSASTGCDEERPTEADLRRLAYEMRSTNLGSGGREIILPTEEQLTSVTEAELDEAREYWNRKLRNLFGRR